MRIDVLRNRSLVLVLSALLIGAAANSPFVGEWKLDPSRTRLTDTMKVENVAGNKYAFDFGGGPETIVVDGTDQPGVDGTMLSVSDEGIDSWKVVRKKDGRLLITAIWNLSKDGKALTDDFTFFNPDGSRSTVHYLYQRTAGSSGFAGTWESTNANMTSVFELKIKPYGEDGLSIINSSQGSTRNLKFDGKDYPKSGANVPAGSVASARLVNDHTLELTDKIKGRILDTQDVEVSSDRKTLTITVRNPGQRQPNIFVFARQ